MFKTLFVKLIDHFPAKPTMLFGALFVIMPIYPQPHLLQRFLMVQNNLLLEPLDWLDIGLHTAGGLLALAAYLRFRHLARQTIENDNA